jgi:uncharacterized repeat protein (TIGR02543 family)
MTIKLKVGSSWQDVSAFKLKVGSAWKNLAKGYIKVGSVWKIFFGKPGPQIDFPLEISSTSTLYPATLTGTNYHWDSGDVFTSKFEYSSSQDGLWNDSTTFETILNPPEGSSNTKTLILMEDNFIVDQSSTFFRFVVKAVNSISNETTTEASDPIEITVPDAVMSHTGDPIVTTSTSISIPFTQNSFLKYYIVEAYGPSGLVSSTQVNTPTSPVVVQNLSPNTTYDIVIFPYNFVDMVGTALLGIGITTLPDKPVNTATPSVTPSSGTQGSTTFSSSTGSWTNSPTSYSYQWQYNDQGSTWLSISGATSSTYLPPSNYIVLYGSSLRCMVIANNGVDSDPAFSNTVTVLSGTRTVYWNANGGSVSPTSNTVSSPFSVIAPTPSRSGYTINGWYDTTDLDFNYFVFPGNTFTIPYDGITMYARWTQVFAPVNTVAPSVTPSTGTAGSTTFSSTTGSWNNSPTSYSYQWQYNDQGSTWLSISGATGSTYLPPSDYVSIYGSSLRCAVTASNSGGSNVAFSNAVTVSAPIVNRTVYWNANGGTVSPASSTASSPWVVTAPTPTRPGYIFFNWRNPQSGDILYTASGGGSFTIPFDGITMYAAWILDTSPPSGGFVSLSGTGQAGTIITATTSGWSGSPTTYSVRIHAGVDGVNYPVLKAINSPTSSNTVSYLITAFDAAPPPYIFIARATATNAYGTSSEVQSGTITSYDNTSPFFPPFFPFFPPFFPFFPPFFPFFPPYFPYFDTTPYFPYFDTTPYFPYFTNPGAV